MPSSIEREKSGDDYPIMETGPKDPHERYKIPIIVILLTAACCFTYYFHVVLGIEVIFTHYFYVPIILASLWWGKRGLVVALFLAAMLIFGTSPHAALLFYPLSRYLTAFP